MRGYDPGRKFLTTKTVKKLEITSRIVVDKETLSGAPRFDGTRIAVHDIADMVANGVDTQAVLRAYPRLTETHIDLAVAYADTHVRPPRPDPFRGWRDKIKYRKRPTRGPSP